MYPNLELELFKAKISVKELAVRCGISESAMRNKIKGKREFKLPEIEIIVAIFPKCDWRYLFYRMDIKEAV